MNFQPPIPKGKHQYYLISLTERLLIRAKALLVILATFEIVLLICFFKEEPTFCPSNPSEHVYSSVNAALTHVFILASWKATFFPPPKLLNSSNDCCSSSIPSPKSSTQSLTIDVSMRVNPFCSSRAVTVDEALRAAFRLTERATLASLRGLVWTLEA